MAIDGPGSGGLFEDEPGGHRWQRIPPTEKSGRVQTSTVTVAVMPEEHSVDIKIPDSELEWSTTTSTGHGGQKVNKTQSCVILKHIPTGLTVRCQNERSQYRNKQLALRVLTARILESAEEAQLTGRSSLRKGQVGSGQRGDKTWTVRVKDGVVTHHATNRKIPYSVYVRGDY